MRVLIAEDEPSIATAVSTALIEAGFAVDVTGDGEDAWYRGDVEDYDAVVLDLGLPRLDGLSVLRKWRTDGRLVPVLILTARGGWMERVEGIDAGADDYLPKPFRMEELVARVRAIVRRAAGRANPLIEAGALTVDTRRMAVTVDGRAVTLAPLEYRLIAYLAHHAGRMVPAQELLDHLYGEGAEREANALEALVARTRRKTGADAIVSRRGFGYMIGEDAA